MKSKGQITTEKARKYGASVIVFSNLSSVTFKNNLAIEELNGSDATGIHYYDEFGTFDEEDWKKLLGVLHE